MADNNIANWFLIEGSLDASDPDNALGLGGPTKQDLYEITGVNAGDTVSVYMAGLAGHLVDPYLQVLDANGNEVAWDDDYNDELGGFDNGSVRGSPHDAFVQFTYQPGYILSATTLREPSFAGEGAYRLYLSEGEAVNANDNLFPRVEDDVRVSIEEDTTHTFGSDDFNFVDPDAGDSLSHIQITALPNVGDFWLDDNGNGLLDATESAVTLNQEVQVEDLSRLSFRAESNAFGEGYATFSYTVSDGTSESQEASYVIDVVNVNDAPVSEHLFIKLSYGSTYTFDMADFSFGDLDTGDQLQEVKLSQLPVSGAVTLNSELVQDGDVISIADIEAGLLVYTSGTVKELVYPNLDFQVGDGTTFSTEQYAAVFLMSEMNSEFGEVDTGSAVMDGVDISFSVLSDGLGNQLGRVTLEPISSTRVDTDNTSDLADIVLHIDGDSPLAWVSLQDGVGLTARDSDTAESINGLDSLAAMLESTLNLQGDAVDTEGMLRQAADFYQMFDSDAGAVWLNHLTFSEDGADSDNALALQGSDSETEVVLLDLSALPENSRLNMDSIDLAFVLGDQMTLNTGHQDHILYGDGGAQEFLLGQGDDQLHAGAGNDEMLVALGSDMIHGGLDTDTAVFSGRYSDYRIEQENTVLTVQHLENSSDNATLVNVELLRFADQMITVDYHDDHKMLTGLYQQVFDRQADTNGLQWWADQLDQGVSIGKLVMSFLDSTEYRSTHESLVIEQSDAAQLDTLYETLLGRDLSDSDQAELLAQMDAGKSIENIAEAVALSEEMQALYLEASAWDFLG